MMKSGIVITGATVAFLALSGFSSLSKEDAARLDKASVDATQALSTANHAEENSKAALASAANAEAAAKHADAHADAAAASAKEAAATVDAMREAHDHELHHGK